MKKYLLPIIAALTLFVIGILYIATQKPEIYIALNPFSTNATTTPLSNYFEVTNSCGPYYQGDTCVNMRSGPGTEYPVVSRLRNGVVLKIGETITANNKKWYKVLFSTELLYPERIKGGLYVSADYVTPFSNEGDKNLGKGVVATTTKHIIVDVSEEKLYAYDGKNLFMEESISTGLEFTPTPRGTFPVFKMTPSRYMQGPIPGVSEQVYDLPGVPWDLYFTSGGAVIHGAYWHDHFGEPWSHGCVNLSPENAKKLYDWAEIGMLVTVRD
jgi:lipoprotein-anchoring transpeptidase ErfK/SrfK